jgi:hypothetical protein
MKPPQIIHSQNQIKTQTNISRVTHIQRVNTIGGTAPAQAGAFVGEEARVPYTAEYYFHRASTR